MVSVRKIERLHWAACEIWGICGPDSRGGVFDELADLYASFPGAITGLREVLRSVAANGLANGLTDAISHQLDSEHQIFEFKKVNVRLIYFKDGGSIVVCTEAFLKKSQKTPRQKIEAAIRMKKEYLAAKAANQLQKFEGAIPK